MRPCQIVAHRVVTAFFKLRQGTALQGRLSGFRRLGKAGGAVDLRQAAAVIRQSQDCRRFDLAALKDNACQEIPVLAHPQSADQGPEIGGVDLGRHVAPEELAAGDLRHLGHVPVHPPVQHNVAELGVPGGIQHGLGLGHSLRQVAGQAVQLAALHSGFQLHRRNTAHVHQHPLRAGAHGGGLQDGLCVVIVIF